METLSDSCNSKGTDAAVHLLPERDSFFPDGRRTCKSLSLRPDPTQREGRKTSARHRLLHACARSAIIAFACVGNVLAAGGTVNVYFPRTDEGTVMSDSFIAATTTQYEATVTQSPFFSNTYGIAIKGFHPDYVPPPLPSVPPEVATLESITRDLTTISTWTYVYGWADGAERERKSNAEIIESYVVECSSPSYFGASPSTWSEGTCNTALAGPLQDIYEKSLVVPVVPMQE